MSAREPIPFNPHMLQWAREWRGRTIEEAANKVGKNPSDISDWESGARFPTVRQARVLAEYYDRHFIEFFLPAPPRLPLPTSIHDFRLHAGSSHPIDSWELRDTLKWIETKRSSALDLFAELGESPKEIPADVFSAITSDPEEAAAKARDAIDFPIQAQISLESRYADTLPNILRVKLEQFGVLTLRNSSLGEFGVRGVCIASFPLPVIAFKSESPQGQAFTLAHEFGHVLSRQSGITGSNKAFYADQPVEKWCDRFAAAFLMPSQQIQATFGIKPNTPQNTINDSDLSRIASIFRVSPHAMLVRLVHLRYVSASYYWDVKKPQFDEEEKSYKSFGRPKYYGSRYKSSLGDLYTGLVIDAWSSGRITNHNAAEYMGIKNLAHLNDIRKDFQR